MMASRRPVPPDVDRDVLRLSEILQRLAAISPEDVEAFTILATDTLRRRLEALAPEDVLRPH